MLLSLQGDVGGKSIIERDPGNVVKVRTKSEAVIKDIDTWKDYKKECRIKKNRKIVR
jgi:CTP:molybdopterin cytidylyltransferase MocA